jgi:hypothetical protein
MRSQQCLQRGAAIFACVLAWLAAGSGARPAHAVPSFAAQTGQPCVVCHVGAFGPQLTPFGRAFKIGGYTQDGGQGPAARIPLAAFVLSSFTRTNTDQPGPAANHFAANNNPALDQVSVFLAGRASDDVGGFVQGTYSGIDQSIILDNTDLRATHEFAVGDTTLRAGLSLNSGPTVQDPYNTTPAWTYPFASSVLAPTPAAAPLLDGGLLGHSIGLTAYAWYDRSVYAEAGAYSTRAPRLLQITGASLGPGATSQLAPYARLAYEWNWNGQSAHVGALALIASLDPAITDISSTGSFGHDRYVDLALDAGYQFLGTGRHVATADLLFLHENRTLDGSVGLGAASRTNANLTEIRGTLTYYFDATYGVTFSAHSVIGSADPVLYAPAPVSGSRNGLPDSTDFVFEADWIPFGKPDSWAAPFANLKLAAQYTAYTKFNGGTSNYDGFGRNASDNNTLYLYAWLAF